ncbi:HGGxSTG domain-containing protein [Ruegeria sp. HKCCSP351]|uniref:HGGxSTG domain-containing protein n=1 Tax=Ruegeria sp. HKCCSP351 TaxID=2794832 RepID=UPI002473EBB7|nr:HGGxSTG domain-containing protein [Ruegeria sp. HKCCSP351]
MAELGLNDSGEPLPKSERPTCGAKTRNGGQCQALVVPGKRRCRLHGGLSTGPKGKHRVFAKSP